MLRDDFCEIAIGVAREGVAIVVAGVVWWRKRGNSGGYQVDVAGPDDQDHGRAPGVASAPGTRTALGRAAARAGRADGLGVDCLVEAVERAGVNVGRVGRRTGERAHVVEAVHLGFVAGDLGGERYPRIGSVHEQEGIGLPALREAGADVVLASAGRVVLGLVVNGDLVEPDRRAGTVADAVKVVRHLNGLRMIARRRIGIAWIAGAVLVVGNVGIRVNAPGPRPDSGAAAAIVQVL